MATPKRKSDAITAEPGYPAPSFSEHDHEQTAHVLVSSPQSQTAQPLDPVAALKAELEAAKTELALREAERQEAQRQEADARQRVDKLILAVAKVEPPQTTANVIRDYIDRQNEERAKRAERRNALLDAGIDPEELRDAVAPLTGMLASKRRRAQRAGYSAV